MTATEYVLLIGLVCNICSLVIAGGAFLRAGRGAQRQEVADFERRMTTVEERMELMRDQASRMPPAAPAELVHAIEDRLARIEGALTSRPTSDQVGQVALSIARLEGGVDAVRAEMRGLRELMERLEARGDRHEAMLTDAARGGAMMAGIADAWWQHLRITLLRVLATAQGCEANDSLLTDVVRGDEYGYSAVTRAQIGAALEWLAEQGLVTLDAPGGLRIARLTGRGEDVAAGRVTVAGVKRPSLRG